MKDSSISLYMFFKYTCQAVIKQRHMKIEITNPYKAFRKECYSNTNDVHYNPGGD